MPKGIYTRKVFQPIAERLLAKTVKTDGCWLWTGAKNRFGHGSIMCDRNVHKNRFQIFAHRASWEIHVGSIPEGMCVLHRCDVPACVNPEHLFLGTKQDNSDDMKQKGRQKKGSLLPQSKLTETDVMNIRQSPLTQKELGNMYGVSQATISFAKNGKRWKHV
jgi:hypothetical protein